MSEAELSNALRAEEDKLELLQAKLYDRAYNSCSAFTQMSDWIQTSARVLEGLELHMNDMKKELNVCVNYLETTTASSSSTSRRKEEDARGGDDKDIVGEGKAEDAIEERDATTTKDHDSADQPESGHTKTQDGDEEDSLL